MSKNLRVFFLSVLVVMLAVTSAFAVDSITFHWIGGSTQAKWISPANWSADHAFSEVKDQLDTNITEASYYPGGLLFTGDSQPLICASIDEDANIILDGSLRGYVSSIDINAVPGVVGSKRMTGKVDINLGTYSMNGALNISVGASSDVAILGSGTLNVGDIESRDVSWDIKGKLTLEAPVKLYRDANINVAGSATAAINKAVSVNSDSLALTVNMGSKATLSTNQPTMLSDFVTITADSSSTLQFTETIGGAPTITFSGDATINVASGKTVTLESRKGTTITSSGKITKTGAGTLVIQGDEGPYTSSVYSQLLSRDTVIRGLTGLTVSAGTLTLNAAISSDGKPLFVYSRSNGAVLSTDSASAISTDKSISFDVASGATLNIGKYAIRQTGTGSFDNQIEFKVKGTLNADELGVFHLDSNFVSADVKSYVTLIADGGTANINGDFAVNALLSDADGNGKVNVADGKELMLLLNESDNLEGNYQTFLGTLTAQNIGLIGNFTDYPFTLADPADASSVGATVSVKTLSVYGGNSSLALTDAVEMADDESIYLRMASATGEMPESLTEFQNNVSVGNLSITSGSVKIPTLKIDGAGKAANTAKISFDNATSNDVSLTVANLRLHENASDVGTYYRSVFTFIVQGEGTFEAESIVGGDGVVADPDASIAVYEGATMKVSGTIPDGNNILVKEGAALSTSNNVAIRGNLTMNTGSMLVAALTANNATDFGKYAVEVTKNLTLGAVLSTDITFEDDELGELPSTYGRRYKLIGVTNADNLKLVSTDFELSGDKIADGTFKNSDYLTDTGVVLQLDIEMQQAVLPDASELSYDKESIGAGKQFSLVIPVEYNSRFANHYKRYIMASPDKIDNDTVSALLVLDPANLELQVSGTAHTKEPTFTITLDWNKGVSSADARNTTISSAWDSTNNKLCLSQDNLQLDYFVPTSKTYTLSGAAEVISGEVTADRTEPTPEKATITSRDESVVLIISGLYEKAASVSSMPVLVNNVYVWNYKDAGDSKKTYVMETSEGPLEITDLRVVVTDEAGNEIEIPADNLTITPANDANSTKIEIATSRLGIDTGKPSDRKVLSVRGTDSNGRTVNSASTTIWVENQEITVLLPDADSGYETLKINADGTVAPYGKAGGVTVTLPEDFGTALVWIPRSLPDWLESQDIPGGRAFTLKEGITAEDITGDSYEVSVVAENASGDRVAYNWTVKVDRSTTEPTKIEMSNSATANVANGAVYTAEFRTNNPVSWDVTGLPSWLSATTNTPTNYVISGTAAETELPKEITYKVTALENGTAVDSLDVTFSVVTPVFEIEEGEDPYSMYEGYNYKKVLTANGVTGKVTWTVKTLGSWLTWTPRGENDSELVLTGVLPAYDANNTDANDHVFNITAQIGTTYAENASEEEPYELVVSVEEDAMPTEAPADIVVPASGVDRGTADKNYSVVVTFPTDPEEEGTVINSEYYLDPESINLPDWLSYDVVARDDNGDILSLRIFAVTVPGVTNGTKGTVRLPADSHTIGWDVVYNAATAPLAFTLSANTVSVPAGRTATVNISVDATTIEGTVSYSVSPDLRWVTISGNTITAAPTAATASGDYPVTVIARDNRGAAGQATAPLTITVTAATPISPDVSPDVPGEFTITPSRTTVTFTSPTDAAQTVTLSSNFLGATVTYSATVSPATGLTASISGSTLTLTPSASGSYTVTVTGTNGERTATATINVTVGTTPVTTFTISANPSTLTFTSPAAADQEVTLSSNFLDATVTYTAEVTSGSEDGLDLDVSGSTLTVDALAAGSYVITVTGTNGERTATTTINVTVGTAPRVVGSSGGGGCDAGFGALALVLAAPLFLRRRRS